MVVILPFENIVYFWFLDLEVLQDNPSFRDYPIPEEQSKDNDLERRRVLQTELYNRGRVGCSILKITRPLRGLLVGPLRGPYSYL